jgi:hypothetical protein
MQHRETSLQRLHCTMLFAKADLAAAGHTVGATMSLTPDTAEYI